MSERKQRPSLSLCAGGAAETGEETKRAAGKPVAGGAPLRELILAALDEAGGAAWLAARAEENPIAFLTLLGKILPMQAAAEAAAAEAEGMAVPVREVRRTIVRPDDTMVRR